ncbi:hypothetical protein RJG79_07845 [Mycoplasmatota bacterium WC44]
MDSKKNRDNYENLKRNMRKDFDVEIAEAIDVLNNYDGGMSVSEKKRINREGLNDNSHKDLRSK